MSVPTWRGTNGSHLICTRLTENSDPGEGYPQTEPPTSSDRAIWSAVPSGACRWRVTLARPLGRGAGLDRGQLLTYCKFEMFGEEILQLGDALVNPVTSLFLDEPVRQFVGLLRSARGDGGRGRTGVRSPPPPPAAARGVGAAEQSHTQNQLPSAPSSPGHSVEAQSPHLAYPFQPQSEKTFTGNSARARGWGPEGRGALTLLSSLRFIPRRDLYTWYIWAKSILQGKGRGMAVTCAPAAGALVGKNLRMRPELLRVASRAQRRTGVEA